MAISLRLSDQDNKLIRDIAELHGMSVSEFIRNAVIERIPVILVTCAYDSVCSSSIA